MENNKLKKNPSALALGTFVKLMRCTETVRQRVHLHLQQIGVTESQLAVLEVLYHKGEMNQQLIGKKILKSKSNMTTVLDNLQKNELIQRVMSRKDKRHQIVSLTEKGVELIGRIFPEHEQEIISVFSGLSLDEQMQLGDLCKKLGQTAK